MAPANSPEPVSQEELNSWRRGFTPQAEIWNGRLAMLGLSVGIGVLVLAVGGVILACLRRTLRA